MGNARTITVHLALRMGTSALLVGGLVLGQGTGLAQDLGTATPVSPTVCTVAPRSSDDVAMLFTAPPGLMRSGMLGTPVATPVLPEGGHPAERETVQQVTATVREAVACLNAGDLLRLFSLYSPTYFLDVWGGIDGPNLSDAAIAARIQALASPVPQPYDQHLTLIAVQDVRVSPDGRVLATVITDRGRSRTVFVPAGDRYLIDWAYALPDESTPAAS